VSSPFSNENLVNSSFGPLEFYTFFLNKKNYQTDNVVLIRY